MSDLFEKRKRMEYLLNTLDNKTFVREHFNGVCNWLNEKGNLYLPAFKIPETGNNGDDFPFKKRRYAKKDMAAVIVDYTAALRDKVRSARRRVPGLFERNLIFVQRLLGLSDLEKEYLGLLVRLECDDETGNIMSEMDSPRCRVNLSEAAIMAGVSRDKAARMSRRDSVLARLGLIDVDCRGAPEASDVAKTFYNTPFESADDVRRFLIGTPVKATLGMTDFAHLPQAEILKKLLASSLSGRAVGINILLYGEPGTGKTEFAKTLTQSVSAPLYSLGENGDSAVEVEQTLDALQEAYNNGRVEKNGGKKPETDFNPALLNTDTDLTRLAAGIERLGRTDFSMCLYGVSGTGKSAFAAYLARRLDLPVVKKRCSDLLSPYVGEAEINIARAFAEARDKEALLIFDEADSFLQDRNGASRSWEISLVNEMLTQMESHDFPFVCTTNLMDRIDKAALRRFTFKVRYDCLTEDQRALCFEHFFGIGGADLRHLPSLTPGDFAVVREKAAFFDCLNDKARLIGMLETEQKNKAPVKHKIGF